MLFKFAQLKREDEILGSERVRVSLGADGEGGGGPRCKDGMGVNSRRLKMYLLSVESETELGDCQQVNMKTFLGMLSALIS